MSPKPDPNLPNDGEKKTATPTWTVRSTALRETAMLGVGEGLATGAVR